MKKKDRKSKTKLFDPDLIVTNLDQKLKRDLSRVAHVYTHDNRSALAVEKQSSEFLKKYCSSDQDRVRLDRETFENFRRVNDHIRDVNRGLVFPSDKHQRIVSSLPYMEKIHLRARALVHWVLGKDVDEDEWFLECKNSGGSSIGVPYSDTSEERKFTFPISCTAAAETRFNRYLDFDFQLKSAIEEYNGHLEAIDIVTGSRATTVDKTTEKRRFICIEPTANMFLQQGLMQVMYKRLQTVGLDVTTLPSEHKRRAWLSSISRKEATIDWSHASDCVSIELLRWLLPPGWFSKLVEIRCTHTLLEGAWCELHMISTMGNATTFPLELLVFWSYGHAVRLSNQKSNTLFPEWEDLSVVSVFGDDCLIPTDYAIPYMECMSNLGFVVNKEKSFFLQNEGFRESCGGDYFHGLNVRPYYVGAPQNGRMSSLEPWLYTILNGLIPRYMRYFGDRDYIYKKEVFEYIFSLFSKHKIKIKLVPYYYPDDSGLKWLFDYERLRLCYEFLVMPIARDTHGTWMFHYCRFVYSKKSTQDPHIRLRLWLKKPFQSKRKPVHKNPIRRIGGYVVAKGYSSHWAE